MVNKNCTRCGGQIYIDEDNTGACLQCGYRDYGLNLNELRKLAAEKVPGRRIEPSFRCRKVAVRQ